MTTLKDIREKLQATLADVDKLEQNLKAGSVNIDDPYRFVPEMDEKYWYISDCGRTNYDLNREGSIDRFRILTGNCYRTEEQAERALEIINRIGELRGDWLPDWGDFKQSKYYPVKDYNEGEWLFDWSYQVETGQIYLPTDKAALTLGDEYGDDLLLVMRRL